MRQLSLLFFFFKNFIYLFLAVLGPCRCMGLYRVVLRRFLTAVISLVKEHRLQ